MANTNLLWQIGIHATAGTSKPSIPNLGSHVDLSSDGFTVLGSVARGDDGDLDEESVTLPLLSEFATIAPPVSGAAHDHIATRIGADNWEFTAYDVSQDVHELDSNISAATNTLTYTMTTTKRTVMLEINGYASLYFPQCVVKMTSIPINIAGDDAAAKTVFQIMPEDDGTITGGVAIDYFQAA